MEPECQVARFHLSGQPPRIAFPNAGAIEGWTMLKEQNPLRFDGLICGSALFPLDAGNACHEPQRAARVFAFPDMPVTAQPGAEVGGLPDVEQAPIVGVEEIDARAFG